MISTVQILQKETGGFSERPVLFHDTTRRYIYVYAVTATNSSSSAKRIGQLTLLWREMDDWLYKEINFLFPVI
jgi:hypothetical protein